MAAAAPSSWTDFPRAVAPVVVSLVLEVLAILAVGLRFYSHRLKRVSTAAHDFAILVALVSPLTRLHHIAQQSILTSCGNLDLFNRSSDLSHSRYGWMPILLCSPPALESNKAISLHTATVLGGLGQHITELSNPTVQLVRFAKVRSISNPSAWITG